ncbi:CG6520 [Drosophila busckii]|uniref:CG6520 n=1 Tax=Drosophila busckii TaxID=30019 RepID=A0A0M4EBU7_DROBS|nr:putative GATA zinc finger domain-containing protein 25 [Drosophila busckii]ALC41077.1 CG6520 [Drosophila busckii]
MSGKLIMKRKRADQQRTQQQEQQQNDDEQQQEQEKRHRLDPESRSLTPPLEPSPASDEASGANSILLEALQKIMELQSELDSFEQELDEREADESSDNEEEPQLPIFVPPRRRSEAEALGFAMCARETLLFLQSEGVSTESLLYKTLLSKLVGQSDGLLQA